MNPEFFYKLGHCRDLAVTEFQTLTGDVNTMVVDSWLISNQNLNVNRTGTLIFGGIILGKMKDYGVSKKSFKDFLEEYLTMEHEIHQTKKVGISVPFKLSHNVINIAKKAGFKKINVLRDKNPNIGNWKGLKEWYIIFFLNGELILGKIDTYFDQEFYSKLDMNLPVSDMRRGQINLKLARSLVNLNTQKSIYDPFVGVGRIPLASMNLKKQFIASDIDAKAVADTKTNYKFGQEYWSKVLRRPVDLVEPIELDSRNINQLNLKGVNWAHIGISTEGYLGTNFNTRATDKERQDQWQIVERLWKDTLQSCQSVKIPEIVLCLPFFQVGKQQLLPSFLTRLEQSTSYSLTSFPNKKPYILYSREKSNVGHMIVKFVLKT